MSFFRRLFRPAAPPAAPPPRPPRRGARTARRPARSRPRPEPAVRRVLMVTHDPVVDGKGTTLSRAMGWYDPDGLARQYIEDVAQASHGLLQYRIAVREVRDGFPVLVDGFRYDAQSFLRCWHQRRGFHTPEGADYPALLREFGVLERVNAGEIDELWLFAGPYAGYYESLMVGPGSFWCNSPPLDRLSSSAGPACRRRFVVMGFNYEREVGCMLENLGHRAESIMTRVYEGRSRGGQPLGALHPLRPGGARPGLGGQRPLRPQQHRRLRLGQPPPGAQRLRRLAGLPAT